MTNPIFICCFLLFMIPFFVWRPEFGMLPLPVWKTNFNIMPAPEIRLAICTIFSPEADSGNEMKKSVRCIALFGFAQCSQKIYDSWRRRDADHALLLVLFALYLGLHRQNLASKSRWQVHCSPNMLAYRGSYLALEIVAVGPRTRPAVSRVPASCASVFL